MTLSSASKFEQVKEIVLDVERDLANRDVKNFIGPHRPVFASESWTAPLIINPAPAPNA